MEPVKSLIPTVRALLAAGLLAAVVAGCASGEPSEAQKANDVERLAPALAIVEELQATGYNNQSWCRHLTYPRGEFTGDMTDEGASCSALDRSPEPFDDQATADFDRLKQALSDSGLVVRSVAQYQDGGIVFTLGGLHNDSTSYVYAPGAPLPEQIPSEQRSVRVNDDWYWQWESWN